LAAARATKVAAARRGTQVRLRLATVALIRSLARTLARTVARAISKLLGSARHDAVRVMPRSACATDREPSIELSGRYRETAFILDKDSLSRREREREDKGGRER